MAWNGIEKIAFRGISLVINVILARLLIPADYGLIGMLAIFLTFSDLFIGSGLSTALIQKANPTEAEYSTVFNFNLLVSVFLYLMIYFSAPLIAHFFESPQLKILSRVLSLIIIIDALSIVQQARLTIKLDFRTQAIISFFAILISGSIGIIMAYNGFSVWALVAQKISSGIVKSSLLFYFNKWIPSLTFCVLSFRRLFGFSDKILAAAFVATIVNNLYSILIGKIFSANGLGYYTRAKEYPELLAGTISSVLQGVTFPILSSLINEKDRMVSVYSRLMGMVVFLVIPLLTLFALLAEPFVRLLLTEKWLPVVPLMQWMCLARMITPISALNMSILNAVGRSDLFFLVDISMLPLIVVTLIITISLGLTALVIGHFITSFICFFINAYYPGKLFNFGAIRQLKEMWRVLFSTLIMSLIVYFSTEFILHDFVKLFVGTVIGVPVFLFTAYLLKIKELDDILELFHTIFCRYNPIST